MATTNAIDNESKPLSSTAVTIDPGASGDSYVQFDINTSGEFRLGVDDTDDSFRISLGSALGTNDAFIITAAGERTMPLQPAFLAYNSATDSNVTGDATAYTVLFNTEVYDQNSDYATGTGIFTAPITGRYLFSTTVLLDDIGASHTKLELDLVASNRSPKLMLHNCSVYYVSGTGQESVCEGAVVDMDASDTAKIQVTVSNDTLTVDVVGDATPSTWFGGRLMV